MAERTPVTNRVTSGQQAGRGQILRYRRVTGGVPDVRSRPWTPPTDASYRAESS